MLPVAQVTRAQTGIFNGEHYNRQIWTGVLSVFHYNKREIASSSSIKF